MRIKLTTKNREFYLQLSTRQKKTQRIYGYSNRCASGHYIVFLDYDNIQKHWLTNELSHLQQMYKLSDFHILASSQTNYHAVCFDKVNLTTLLHIYKNSTVDPAYIYVPLHFGKKLWTLRLTDKNKNTIRYEECLRSPHCLRQKSTPHMALIEKMFGAKPNKHGQDYEKKMVLSTYLA